MLTRRVRIQVVLFVIIAALGVSWVGIRYVGLEQIVHNTGYDMSVDLPAAGGLFQNAEVTYRGVPIGRVHELALTSNGVRATLAIDGSAPKIPADVTAVVADRSVIGEQYLDLRPQSDGGPYLHAGSVLTADSGDLPPSVNTVLTDARDFVASVPLNDLRTVVNQLYLAFRGVHDPLRKLIQTSANLASTADENIDPTQQLIANSSTVLATQEQSAGSIRSFSHNLRLLSGTLKSSDKDFDSLLTEAPDAAQQIQDLFVSVGQPLGVVLSNLISTAQVFGSNADGIRSILVQLPHVVDEGYEVTSPTGLRGALVSDLFDSPPCALGYQGTPLRSGLDTTPGQPLSQTVGGCVGARSGAAGTASGTTSGTASGTTGSRAAATRAGSTVSVRSPHTLAQLLGGR